MNRKARRVALCGLLLALMLVLGYLESLLPITVGIPGIKLGLSNSVLIFAVYMLDLPTAFILMTLKVVLSGLLFSGVSTILYAFSGGLFSLIVMILLRKTGVPEIIVSAAGGAAHNIAQLAVAMLVLHTPALIGYGAVLIPCGVATGLLTGFAAKGIIRRVHV